MELTEKQIHKFAEIERCYSQYFNTSITPVMDQVRREIDDKQIEEMKDYFNSMGGILSMISSNPLGGPSKTSAEKACQIGMWSRLKTENYVAMCQERIGKSERITADLKLIADDWRNELVSTVGRERYDEMSKELGTDLSYAYTGFRVERLMIDRLIFQNMPKSSLDYVLKSAAENSLLGLPAQLKRTPLDREIQEAGEKAYEPSSLEKGTGKVLSFGMDTVATTGFSSWVNVGKLALFEVASEGAGAVFDSTRSKTEEPGIEQIISQGVFGGKDVIGKFRRESVHIDPQENDYIRGLDDKMKGRMRLIPEKNLAWMKKCSWEPEFKLDLEGMKNNELTNSSSTLLLDKKKMQTMKNTGIDIPSVVLPSGKDTNPALQQEQKSELDHSIEKVVATPTNKIPSDEMVLIEEQKTEPSAKQTPSSPQASSSGQNGWGGLLSSIGLSDVGGVGRNMGYVISMLPDLLVGLFTGKTKSLKLMDNLFPIASILMGLFSKNPIMRTLLVGLGGMNLLNKAGHESLDKKTSAQVQTAGVEKREYKTYPDEPLNSRVANPEIKGDYLLATVDGVPCTIHLPEATVGAYRAGALPLNTLVNAVLSKSDELRALAQENYEAKESRNVQGRGIG